MELSGIGRDKILVDVGHGMGNIPIQAAYTGLVKEARGIELVSSRHLIAEQMLQCLEEERLQIFLKAWPNKAINSVGDVRLRHGKLEDPAHRSFLVGVDLAIVNNAHGVFAERATNET